MRSLLLIATALMSAPLSAASTKTARLGQPVRVGRIRVIPLRIVEDSRCPRFVTCVWRGRLRIKARVGGAVRTLDDGKTIAVRYGQLTLIDARPLSERGERIPAPAYRFTFRFDR